MRMRYACRKVEGVPEPALCTFLCGHWIRANIHDQCGDRKVVCLFKQETPEGVRWPPWKRGRNPTTRHRNIASQLHIIGTQPQWHRLVGGPSRPYRPISIFSSYCSTSYLVLSCLAFLCFHSLLNCKPSIFILFSTYIYIYFGANFYQSPLFPSNHHQRFRNIYTKE